MQKTHADLNSKFERLFAPQKVRRVKGETFEDIEICAKGREVRFVCNSAVEVNTACNVYMAYLDALTGFKRFQRFDSFPFLRIKNIISPVLLVASIAPVENHRKYCYQRTTNGDSKLKYARGKDGCMIS